MNALAAKLGAPLKSAVLAAVRAALIVADNSAYPAVRKALQ